MGDQIVYLVTEGEYSAYGVVEVYDAEGDARVHADMLNRDSYHQSADVEPFILRRSAPKRRVTYTVRLDPETRETHVQSGHPVTYWGNEGHDPVEVYVSQSGEIVAKGTDKDAVLAAAEAKIPAKAG